MSCTRWLRAYGPTFLPVLVMAWMCSFRVDGRATWRDEHATWWAATLDREAFYRLLSHIDMVLAPYYVMMRGWVSVFGDSELALRAPSVLAMSACAGLTSVLGKRLFGAVPGMLAGLFLATLPSVSRYGQEARPYALAMTAAVAALLLLVHAAARPNAVARWCGYSVGVCVLGAFHLVALCSLFAHLVMVLDVRPTFPWLRSRARVFWRFALCVAMALAALWPLAWSAHRQSAQIAWTLELDNSLLAFPQLVFHARYVGVFVIALGMLALLRPDRGRLSIAAWACGCPLFLYVTQPVLHFFVHRYMLFTLPAWCLLSGVALDDLARAAQRRTRLSWLRPALSAALVLVTLFLGRKVHTKLRFTELHGSRTLRETARYLAPRVHAGDGVAFAGEQTNWLRMGLRYEFREGVMPRDVFMAESPEARGQFLARECSHAEACLPAELERLWLVTSSSPSDLYAGVARDRAALLRARFVLVGCEPLKGVTVAEFVRK